MYRLILIWTQLGIILCLAIYVCGCDIAASDISFTEVKRVTSPNKDYDLVSYEVSGGATVSYTNDLYLTKVGEKNRELGALILKVCDKYPTEIKWQDSTHIILNVGGNKFDHFTNYGYTSSPDGSLNEIRFLLK